MKKGPREKSKGIKVTPSDRRSVAGFGLRSKPWMTTQTGRLKLLAASFIFAFLLSSFPLGAAGRGGFTFVLIKEFKGEVVDNETGALVDNVEIWGEIHSTTLYFWVRFNRDTYSYKIWDANKQLLRSADDLPTVYGRFVLPISDLLGDNEKHYFQLEAKAEGYATTTMEGTFHAYEDKPLQIRLNKLKVEENLNDGEFSFDLGSSQGVMVHKRQGKMSKVQREQGYAQEDWILAGTPEAEAKKEQLRAEGKEAIIESRARQERVATGEWETLFETAVPSTAQMYMGVEGYRVTSRQELYQVHVGYLVDVKQLEFTGLTVYTQELANLYSSKGYELEEGAEQRWSVKGSQSWDDVSEWWYNRWTPGDRLGADGYKYHYWKGTYREITGYSLTWDIYLCGKYLATTSNTLSVSDASNWYVGKSISIGLVKIECTSKSPIYGPTKYRVGYSYSESVMQTYWRVYEWHSVGRRYVTTTEYNSPPSGYKYTNASAVTETRPSTIYTVQRQRYEWLSVSREFIVGERWTERAGSVTWVWEPSEVEVPVYLGLTGGTRAEVELEVYTPPGIEAELDLSEFHMPYTRPPTVTQWLESQGFEVDRQHFGFYISFDENGEQIHPPPDPLPFRPCLRLRVDGSPGVRNTITISARRTDGGLTRIREYTLWVFEEGDIGRVVLEDGPPYSRAGKDDPGGILWADAQSLANPDTGEVLVKAASGGLGYADAWVVQYLEGDRGFIPSGEEVRQGIIVEGEMSLKAFVIGDAFLAGVSYGQASGVVEAGDKAAARTLAWSLDVDVSAVVTVVSRVLPGTIREITNALDTFEAITDPIEITNRMNNILNAISRAGLGDLETEVIRYSPEGLQAGQRYRLGAGVKVVSASGGIAYDFAVVVGRVDKIRVRIGVTPTLKLSPLRDTSGMGHQVAFDTIHNPPREAGGLRGWALEPQGRNFIYNRDPFIYKWTNVAVMVPYKYARRCPVNALKGSFEAWVKPTNKGEAKIISIGADRLLGRNEIYLGTSSGGFRFRFNVLRDQADLVADYIPGEWHHIVATWRFQGSTLVTALYVDGRLVTGTPLGAGEKPDDTWLATFSGNPPVEIGEYFDGLIEEICIYYKVLSSDEVAARWRAGPSPFKS